MKPQLPIIGKKPRAFIVAIAMPLAIVAASAQTNSDAIFHAPPKPLAKDAVVSDWPSFLGPNHNMVSPETKLLKSFGSGEPKLVWEIAKGLSYSAPAIADGKLVLFHRVGDSAVVDCLDATNGNRFWRFSYDTAYHDRYGYNHGPRCSPVIANGSVFTYGADGKLHCLDLATGKVRWQHDILSEFKLKQNFFGVGATPLVEGDELIVNVGADNGQCVVAFDTKTGKQNWSAGDKWGPSYASPIPATINGRRYIFVFAGGESDPATGGLLAIDAAKHSVEFSFPWRGRRYESVNASSPLVLGNQVFVSECYRAGGALLSLPPAGGYEVAWTNEHFGTHFMTAVEKDGCLYGVDGHGPGDAFFVCVDLKTGHELWRAQPKWEETFQTNDGPRTKTVGTCRCSLLMADGGCLCLGEYGHLIWLDLNPRGYKEISRASLFLASDSWTPPVLSHGLLYICQNNRDPVTGSPPRLLCYDLRAAE